MHLSIFILVVNQLDAQNLFYNKFSSCLYMFRRRSELYYTASGIMVTCFTISLFHASTCFEHHVLIVRRSELYYTASGIMVTCFTVSLFHASTCFEHHVLIVRRSELYYTASGIITMIPEAV